MKTLKIKLLALGIMLAMMSVVFLSHARDGKKDAEINDQEYFEQYMFAEDMVETPDTPVKLENNIKIYDTNLELIATGNKDDDHIESYMRVSDLLIELEETEYYILSY